MSSKFELVWFLVQIRFAMWAENRFCVLYQTDEFYFIMRLSEVKHEQK
jgi:hypothetical protein